MNYFRTLLLVFIFSLNTIAQASEEEKDSPTASAAVKSSQPVINKQTFLNEIRALSEISKQGKTCEELVPYLFKTAKRTIDIFKQHEKILYPIQYAKLVTCANAQEVVTVDSLFESNQLLRFFIDEETLHEVEVCQDLGEFQKRVLAIPGVTSKHIIDQLTHLNSLCYLYCIDVSLERSALREDLEDNLASFQKAEALTKDGRVLRDLVHNLKLEADSPCVTYLSGLESLDCHLVFPLCAQMVSETPAILKEKVMLEFIYNCLFNRRADATIAKNRHNMHQQELEKSQQQIATLQELNKRLMKQLEGAKIKAKQDDAAIVRNQDQANLMYQKAQQHIEENGLLKSELAKSKGQALIMQERVKTTQSSSKAAVEAHKKELKETKAALVKEHQDREAALRAKLEEEQRAALEAITKKFENEKKQQEEAYQARIIELEKALAQSQMDTKVLEDKNVRQAKSVTEKDAENATLREQSEAVHKTNASMLQALEELDIRVQELKSQLQAGGQKTASLEDELKKAQGSIESSDLVQSLQERISAQNRKALDYDRNMEAFYWENERLKRELATLSSQLAQAYESINTLQNAEVRAEAVQAQIIKYERSIAFLQSEIQILESKLKAQAEKHQSEKDKKAEVLKILKAQEEKLKELIGKLEDK